MDKLTKQKNTTTVDSGRPRPVSNGMKKDLSAVLIRPHVTEKATMSSETGVYIFQIDPRSSKSDVMKAFVEKYKITPLKVSTATIPASNVFVRGKAGKKSGYKKAYVYLKKGTKIENL